MSSSTGATDAMSTGAQSPSLDAMSVLATSRSPRAAQPHGGPSWTSMRVSRELVVGILRVDPVSRITGPLDRDRGGPAWNVDAGDAGAAAAVKCIDHGVGVGRQPLVDVVSVDGMGSRRPYLRSGSLIYR